jgi:hypothetical protein
LAQFGLYVADRKDTQIDDIHRACSPNGSRGLTGDVTLLFLQSAMGFQSVGEKQT